MERNLDTVYVIGSAHGRGQVSLRGGESRNFSRASSPYSPARSLSSSEEFCHCSSQPTGRGSQLRCGAVRHFCRFDTETSSIGQLIPSWTGHDAVCRAGQAPPLMRSHNFQSLCFGGLPEHIVGLQDVAQCEGRCSPPWGGCRASRNRSPDIHLQTLDFLGTDNYIERYPPRVSLGQLRRLRCAPAHSPFAGPTAGFALANCSSGCGRSRV